MKSRFQTLLEEVKPVAQKAFDENRDFTADEKAFVEPRLREIREMQKGAKTSSDILGQLDDMARGRIGTADASQHLTFGKSWSAAVADKLMPQGIGSKAVAAGPSVFVDVELSRTPIPMGRPATSLLDLIPAMQHGQPLYRYLRQSVRTNNAAVVAEGAQKPTSVYTIVPIDGALSVIAHLSEGVPRYWFEDAAALKPFIQDELAYGLRSAVEAKVLADINATSGIQIQAYSTSMLQTLRKSVTAIEVQGHTPGWFLLNPSDWETIELDALANAQPVDLQAIPFDPVARRLFGLPVVVSNAQAAGVSHTVATGAVAVDTDTQGVAIQWTETSNADDFGKNLVRARCEGRFGTSVYQPMGVVKGDLTA